MVKTSGPCNMVEWQVFRDTENTEKIEYKTENTENRWKHARKSLFLEYF